MAMGMMRQMVGRRSCCRKNERQESQIFSHAYIDVSAKTRVDTIKFQMQIAGEESIPGVPMVNIDSRQNSREGSANVVDVENHQSAVSGAIEKQAANGRYKTDSNGQAGNSITALLGPVPLSMKKVLAF